MLDRLLLFFLYYSKSVWIKNILIPFCWHVLPYIEFVNTSFIWSYFDLKINIIKESCTESVELPMNILQGGNQNKAKITWIEVVQEIRILTH